MTALIGKQDSKKRESSLNSHFKKNGKITDSQFLKYIEYEKKISSLTKYKS